MPQFDIPEECLLSVKYPTAILSALKNGKNGNDDNEYSLFGVLCEKMLRHPLEKITIETLLNELKDCKDLKKISSSKTTPPFIEKLRQTRIEFDNVVKGKIVYDTVLEYKSVQGHPYGQTETQLFKVKMTEKEWKNFLLEAYSYGSLELRATELFLVLPLHGKVINLKLDDWSLKNRMKWRDLLVSKPSPSLNNDIKFGMIIQRQFNIGMHVQKKPSLVYTLEGLNDIHPFQIFLGNPSSAKLSISDAELAKAADVMGKKRVYVHTPYIINLCKDGLRDEALVRNIEYSKKAGCKGVVVHVGKSTTKPLSEAMENMRKTIADAMTFATPDCPLLLETPAGQGTETLTDREEFLGFVMSFGDPRLALCVDTCHVFTNGHDPLEYLKRAHETGLLRLVHFNDSASTCGACVDRHAYIGTGHLGPEKMTKLASFCSVIGVDMVIE
jgi:deoxyribonuclease-4